MNNLVGLLIMSVLLLATILFIIKSLDYIRSFHHMAKNKPREASEYAKNLILGVVSGAIVLIVENILRVIVEGISNFNLTENAQYPEIIGKSFGVLIVLLFLISLMLFLILFTANIGRKAFD